MTVKKATRCGGYASIVARQKLHNTQQLDILTIKPAHTNYNITVGFNEKDQLQLTNKDDDENKNKQENIPIDDITNCVNIENYPNSENTLVFYVTKNLNKEAIALKFENEQDFKRIYFTYKYFKMRNRLTNNTNNYTDSVFSKKNYNLKNRNSLDDFSLYEKKDYETDDGLTLVQPKSRFDQPMSLIGIRNDLADIGEIDSVIYTTDIDIPNKPDRKRLFHKKPKAPPPPVAKDTKVLKGEFVRVNVERTPDIIPKDNKVNKVPDILMFRDSKLKKNSPTSNLWTASNKVTGYESDREDWRNSRSQFSTTAFDSLARPTKAAMALTLRKPQRIEPVQYYRLPSEKPKLTPLPKFTSLQNLELPKKLSEVKKPVEVKKTNHSNLSHKITGLTNKLRDLGNPNGTLGRFKAQSHSDVANLKPVLKDGKRSVVRTCSAEPPKKVTFSAFATVQVV
ncbi:hypothetical protein NE865_11608 [Phthorimaea operculella]|nr:hypothetical protein NE865_11608 [Phthorimaea operculella]